MAFKIQCPGCETKLKLAAPPAKDVKLKCPKCEKSISVKAAAKPAEKEEVAEPSPVAAPAGKAAAKAKAAAKPAKAKATTKKKKAKAKAAPVQDEWDDYEDLDGDFDDFEDDYDDYQDDYDDPQPARGRKRKGGGAAKGKAKAAPASSGSKKGLIVGLGILLGVGLIGGIVYAVMATSGEDDPNGIASNERSTNGGSEAAASGSPTDTTGNTPTEEPKVDARGQNFVNLQYVPGNADAVVFAKVSDLLTSPLVEQFKDVVPPQLQDSSELELEAVESVVLAFWSAEDSQAQGAVEQSGLVVPAVAQMGQGFGPPGGNGQFGGPGMMAQSSGNFLYIARTSQDVKPSDMGEVRASSTHNGQEIFDVAVAAGPPEAHAVWMPDSRTIVGGMPELVKEAIDRGSSENRFERFDFAKSSSSHLTVAFAPHDPAMMANAPPLPPERVSINLAEDLKAACLHFAVTDALKIDAQIVCKDSAAASKLQQDVSRLIAEGKQKLAEQIKSMGFLGTPLVPVQKILDRVTATSSSDEVIVSADATNEELTALSKSAGPFIAMMGSGQGGPPGFGQAGFGPPGMGGEDDVPFSQQEMASTQTVEFDPDIVRIVKWRCSGCHVDKAEGGLSLRSYETLMAHSSDAGKAVTPGDPAASSLFTVLRDAPEPHPKLKPNEIAVVKAWIESGAKPPGDDAK